MTRRTDIDWLRVIAIGLLLAYHTAIGFQSWGFMIGFLTNDRPIEVLWIPMSLLNVWRIPLLFFVSGMGLFFASERRDWRQLLAERARRILVPFVFGCLVVVPVQIWMIQGYYHQRLGYVVNPAHLWFLGNIFIYVLAGLPLLLLIKRRFALIVQRVFGGVWGLPIVVAAFAGEVLLVKPLTYELYAMTGHGFFLGFLAFVFGFCFVLAGEPFWRLLGKGRWVFLGVAIALYTWRLLQPFMRVPAVSMSIESNAWVLTVLAFGHKHLNRPGRTLRYLSEAAYPIYIVHMIFLNGASALVFPMKLVAPLKFVLVLVVELTGCFVLYEGLIRRVPFLRVLFGLKPLTRGHLLIKA
ncbi:MAG TPA: acyltransferase family protein [Puia sp.]|uniref:acyltransferase family protein n=1 Tax=Puia sp. TaxID=2045100 RepID=UPI002C97A536|nr:acyltransferase family protein [Puia sp.]HVU94611.1 acyltransferase family protein [Puia sp.]